MTATPTTPAPDSAEEPPFVTLTPESEARGFRFPNEAERAALLTSLGSMELPQE